MPLIERLSRRRLAPCCVSGDWDKGRAKAAGVSWNLAAGNEAEKSASVVAAGVLPPMVAQRGSDAVSEGVRCGPRGGRGRGAQWAVHPRVRKRRQQGNVRGKCT
jgi:hypothetical protein